MTVCDSRQGGVFDVREFCGQPYEEGSIYQILDLCGELIIRREDFPETSHGLGGGESWCPVLETKLVLLQNRFGWTDREAVRRASYDLQVKACLGLGVEAKGPSQPTLCRHRLQMDQLQLDQVYQRRLTDLLEVVGLLDKTDAVAVDTVPIRGAGRRRCSTRSICLPLRSGGVCRRLRGALGRNSPRWRRRSDWMPTSAAASRGPQTSTGATRTSEASFSAGSWRTRVP